MGTTFDLQGKVALITGGISGIGLSIVKEFLKNGLRGVAIVDYNSNNADSVIQDINEEFGDKAIFIQANVCSRDQFLDAFQKTIEKFNNLDVVINNAALIDEKQWEKEINTNIGGTVNGSLLALEYIQKYRITDQGIIINMASVAGVNISGWNPIYTATKHAVVGLSRSFGLDVHYKRTQIKILTICPGTTETNFMNITMEDKALSKEYFELYLSRTKGYSFQPPSHVAKELVLLMKNASNGSIWVIEDNEPAYELEIPHYRKMRK